MLSVSTRSAVSTLAAFGFGIVALWALRAASGRWSFDSLGGMGGLLLFLDNKNSGTPLFRLAVTGILSAPRKFTF